MPRSESHLRVVGFITIAQLILCLCIALSSTAQAPTSASAPAKPADEEVALRAFAAIHPIDVHVHVFKTDPAFQKMLERLNLKAAEYSCGGRHDSPIASICSRRSMTHWRWCGRAMATLPCVRPSIRTKSIVLRSVPMPSSRSTATSRREPWRSRSGRTSEWKSRDSRRPVHDGR